MSTYSIILIIHVIGGFSALVSGIIAMQTKKGAKNHTISGNTYYYSMLLVFITIIPMFIIKGAPILFLFLIGIFSFYQVYTGVRFYKVNNKKHNLRWHDYLTVSIATFSTLYMLTKGAYEFIYGIQFVGILLMVFGLVLGGFAWSDLKWIYQISKGIQSLKNPLAIHIQRMGGAYIATFTAFIVNNISFLPYGTGWFLPGIIGGFIINRTIKKYTVRKKEKSLKMAA